MTDIPGLPANGSLTPADLLVIHQPAEGSNNDRRVTREDFLAGYVASGDDVTLGDVDADELNAPVGAIDALTVATSLVMGATLSRILTATASVAVGTLAAGASEDVTMSVTGAITGDVVIVNPQVDMPDGLTLRPYVSGANTVTINVTNASTGAITGASYSIKAVLLRVT